MKAKLIAVGDGYEVRFTDRARGEETPYFQAEILRDGKVVGRANNGGRGGSTIVTGRGIAEAFREMVFKAARDAGFDPQSSLLAYEPEGVVLDYALCKGYQRGCSAVDLKTFVRAYQEAS